LAALEGVGVAEDRAALDEDDEDRDDEDRDDEEVAVDVAEDLDFSLPVAVDSDGEFSAVVVAGAVVGEDGVDGVVSRCEEVLVSSPRVVVPDGCELVTSADTGFCPMNSIPVTMPMATTKTATA
jgi:hypothetical protein